MAEFNQLYTNEVPETETPQTEQSKTISGTKKALLTLAIVVAPTMFASAQTTETDPEKKKPTTEQVPVTTDSNKVVVLPLVKPRTRNLDASTAGDDVVDQAQQEANTAKQEANTAKQEANTAKQKANIAQQAVTIVTGKK